MERIRNVVPTLQSVDPLVLKNLEFVESILEQMPYTEIVRNFLRIDSMDQLLAYFILWRRFDADQAIELKFGIIFGWCSTMMD